MEDIVCRNVHPGPTRPTDEQDNKDKKSGKQQGLSDIKAVLRDAGLAAAGEFLVALGNGLKRLAK